MVGNPSSGDLCTRHGVRGTTSADLVGDCTLVCKLETMRWYNEMDGNVTDRGSGTLRTRSGSGWGPERELRLFQSGSE